MKLYILSGAILLLMAGTTLAGNSLEVTGQSDLEEAQDILNTAANATANATGELMTQAENVLNLTSDAASNATADAIKKAEDAPSSAPNATQEGLKKYENTNIGLRFSYPSYWRSLEEEGECTVNTDCSITSTAMGTSGNINDFMFRVAVMPSGYWEIVENCKCDSLIEFVQYMYKEAERVYVDDFKFINDSQILAGKKYPAWQVEYSAGLDPESEQMTHTNIFTKDNNTFYSISYLPLSINSSVLQLSEFRKIIDSIEFFPVNRTVPKTPSFLNSSSMPTKGTESLSSMPTKGTESSLDSSNGVKILSHNSFTDSLGYLHVVGEVQNNSPTNAQFVQVTGTFYDNNNQVVATDFTYTNPSDIGPRQKAPFDLTLLSASIPITQIDHYNLVASYQ